MAGAISVSEATSSGDREACAFPDCHQFSIFNSQYPNYTSSIPRSKPPKSSQNVATLTSSAASNPPNEYPTRCTLPVVESRATACVFPPQTPLIVGQFLLVRTPPTTEGTMADRSNAPREAAQSARVNEQKKRGTKRATLSEKGGSPVNEQKNEQNKKG